MAFEDNLKELCEEYELKNPVREEDLWVESVSFEVDGETLWFDGTELNRGARLFFQVFSDEHGYSRSFGVTSLMRHAASSFFAERWEDAETTGRPVLMALKKAQAFDLHNFKRNA